MTVATINNTASNGHLASPQPVVKESPLKRIRKSITSPFKKKGTVKVLDLNEEQQPSATAPATTASPTVKANSWDEMSSVSGISSSSTAASTTDTANNEPAKLSKSKKRALRRQRAKRNRKLQEEQQAQKDGGSAVAAPDAAMIATVPSTDESTTSNSNKNKKKRNKKRNSKKRSSNNKAVNGTVEVPSLLPPLAVDYEDNDKAAATVAAAVVTPKAQNIAAVDTKPVSTASKKLVNVDGKYMIVPGTPMDSTPTTGAAAPPVALLEGTAREVSVDVYADPDAKEASSHVFGNSTAKKEDCECNACVIS
mmetsp:Transcript_54162/g.131435  ORF Transcript_54162/g.131435 Transcript_54162/m.131435 type:complete len:309 (-) Transcript_54162:223-1149(-)